ncbi:MAG: hypothetical protein ACR2QS_12355 [Woeseiaceae bacterium]
MEFSGPEAADLADVRALNTAFLDYLCGPLGRRLRDELPAGLGLAVRELSERQIQRLSTVPFLLMSCQEQDDEYWQAPTNAQSVRDLFAPTSVDTDPISQITSATLGFLWQLARKNAYAVRMVCGASPGWCEQLVAYSLLDVLQRTASDPQLLVPRLANEKLFWHRLLGAGLNSNAEVRRAAHLSALQAVLVADTSIPSQRFRSAACRSQVPAFEISERRDE